MNQLDQTGLSRNDYFAIPCFYDSHLHLQGLGKYNQNKDLKNLSSINDLTNYLSSLQGSNQQTHEGFGFKKSLTFDLPHLDQTFKVNNPNNFNFYFVLEDGHQLIVHGPVIYDFFTSENFSSQTTAFKKALKTYGSTCIFQDENRKVFDRFFLSSNNCGKSKFTESHILKAQNILIQSGVTHFRDLTSDLDQFAVLHHLIKEQKFNLYAETFFSDFFGDEPLTLIKHSLEAKGFKSFLNSKENTNLVEVDQLHHKGIKLFVDGTFSQHSVDSQCFHKTYGTENLNKSFVKYSENDLVHYLRLASQNNLEVAFHTIGDGAVEKVINAFDIVKDNFQTQIHLEHCELINVKTLSQLESFNSKAKSQIRFHFQPSHYLMDKTHLDAIKSIDPDLFIFAWSTLVQLGYNVHFGSDAPVASPGLSFLKEDNFSNFFRSEKEKALFWSLFSHPDFKHYPNIYTLFKNMAPTQVRINSQNLLSLI